MHYSSVQGNEGLRESQQLREIEYFQGMYPESMKNLQAYVSAECDKMEYQGSPMYDEYPDQMMIHQMCRNICQSIPRDMAGVWGDMLEDTYEMDQMETYQIQQRMPTWGPPTGLPPWGPPGRPPHRPWPGHHRNNRLNDIVRILLLNELHRRRCRGGRCF